MKNGMSWVMVGWVSCALGADVTVESLDASSDGNKTESPHVLFVNVNGAVSAAELKGAVTNIVYEAPVHLAYASVPRMDYGKLLQKNPENPCLDRSAKLVVYVVNDPQTVSFVSVPKEWALVNVAGFETNNPLLNSVRLKKLMLKGFALACGAGGNHDSTRCVMAVDSFSPATIDSTGISYSPFASAPVQTTLDSFAGIYLDEPGVKK